MRPSPLVSVQEQCAPTNRCFGCGPANIHGLRLRSFLSQRSGAAEGEPHAEFQPAPHHLAFEGIVWLVIEQTADSRVPS
jgi:hypothetical protein